MDLYVFGFNGHAQLAAPSSSRNELGSKEKILAPEKVLQGSDIQVLWTSWCDSIIALETSKDDQPSFQYYGMGLNDSQIARATDPAMDPNTIRLFGAPLADGLKAILQTQAPSSITFFASDLEQENQVPTVEIYNERDNTRIQHIAIHSDAQITVVVKMLLTATSTGKPIVQDMLQEQNSYILTFKDLSTFKTWLTSDQPTVSLKSASRPVPDLTQLVSGATTLTALTATGQVYTWTPDPRYPNCLGRPNENPELPTPIPYLSETRIAKIAAGGYLSGALSADGELFVWGQSPPGIDSEFRILKPKSKPQSQSSDADLFIPEIGQDMYLPPPPPRYTPWSPENAEKWAREVAVMRRDGRMPRHPDDPRPEQLGLGEDDDEGDEFVKQVDISIQGRPATVTDVAVGHGHVLVAAEANGDRNKVLRAVFAAGQGESGQLGLGSSAEFVENFTEVEMLRDKKVKSLICAGWSSWVVVERGSSEESDA
ncbi:hypothetical protein CC78DRAFT_534011 [Lojkania enalia]|uniref:Uncharacterized protein n=1 Tax=Lojkania enalia TaxID=147567 RepID=A0A9P4N5J0_9PLEO|nr:hypothetical protein CC78DRAFT_534011 [Didymosphaeria enalia]